MKIRLTKGHPPKEQCDKVCPICGINSLKLFKNAWLVDGFEAETIGHKGSFGMTQLRTRIVKSVNVWTCSKLCAEMALLQNM